MTIELGVKQLIQYSIIGIKNGKHQAAINLLQDCLDQLNNSQTEEETQNEVTKQT